MNFKYSTIKNSRLNEWRKQRTYYRINSYTKLVKDLSSGGGYEHQNRELEVTQKEMAKSVEEAEKLIQKIEEKMNE